VARAFLFVLDSFGIGGAPDAERFSDLGADTYGHIAAACARGQGDRPGLRSGPLDLPNMNSLGLRQASALATGNQPPSDAPPTGFFGAADETSRGKDTQSGHWEIAGVPGTFDWGYFPQTVPALPASLTAALVEQAGLPGILGDCHASGTEILQRFGEEHVRTGKPILYTSTDSVLQIAAHEQHFGLQRLYDLCATARRLVDPLNIGRVIARPFTGEGADGFVRTGGRRDYSVPPPEPTLLDRLKDRGSRVFAVGKIADIFAQRGVTDIRKAPDNMAMFDAALAAIDESGDGDLVFVNFVDFDSDFGHRRDVPGYAAALEAFDRRLPEAFARLRAGDMLVLTGDHGCDPTWKGTDHTRERVPILGAGPELRNGSVGIRSSFADIGATIAEHLGIDSGPHGRSFLDRLVRNA
jgi:phosphopentomutase